MTDHAALLLIDTVDSVKLGEQLGDAAASTLWATHDRLARELMRDWRGREIDKSDGFLVLFPDSNDAVSFAAAYHRAIAGLSHPLVARAGLHFGPITVRKNLPEDVARGAKPLEIDGLTKSITARVMSLACGGQTLLTDQAKNTITSTTWRVVSHGHWRVKGIEDPIQIFEIGDPDAPFAPPPDSAKAFRVARLGDIWLPTQEIRHSIPAERDNFIGREGPLRQLADLLTSDARLVSVVGMGGIGKTRLATRFARAWLGEFPGGAWFCDLSQAQTLDAVFVAVALGLDVPLGKGDTAAQLGHAIDGHGRCLLILDNFEQVTRFSRETIGRWLDEAPAARVLVTTRQILGLPGEHSLLLDPLANADGVALFMSRAKAARPNLLPSVQDRAEISQIVAMLDGLPLAIELAAARLRIMSPGILRTRLSERFKLLSSGGGRVDRQATLRGTIDWSWDLLNDVERAALAQTSVFVGGFTLVAAESVLNLSTFAGEVDGTDAVQLLVEKSLVRYLSGERFDLLESVREYAGERLHSPSSYPGSGPQAKLAAEASHGRFFSVRPQDVSDMDELRDIENVAAACRRAVGREDASTAFATCERAWIALRFRGPYRVTGDLADLSLTTPGLTDSQRARLHFIRGRSHVLSGDAVGARPHLEVAHKVAHEAGNETLAIDALSALAELNLFEGRMEEAHDQYQSALKVASELGIHAEQCAVLNGLGTYHLHLGQFEPSRQAFESALKIARDCGDRRWQGAAIGNLGQVLADMGATDQALPLLNEAVAIARSLGERVWEGNSLCNLGLMNHAAGHQAEAKVQLESALAIAREAGLARLESVVLCNLGLVYERLTDDAGALRAYEAAVAIARRRNDRRCEGQFLGYLGLLHARQGRVVEAERCLEVGAAILREIKDQMSLAILLCCQSEAHSIAGHATRSEMAIEEACTIADALGVAKQSELGVAIAQARNRHAVLSGTL